MKHTPGPWTQYDNHPIYGKAGAGYVWGPKGPGHGAICNCATCATSYEEAARAENIANAKLVAAAPDLLEALRDLNGYLNAVANQLPATELPAVLDAIKQSYGQRNQRSPGRFTVF